MSKAFAVGTKVKVETNFYGDPEIDNATGVVQRSVPCENPKAEFVGLKCDCGSGGTVFVKLDNSDRVYAYIATELTEI